MTILATIVSREDYRTIAIDISNTTDPIKLFKKVCPSVCGFG
jgi:hypothetical protein